MEQPGEPSQLGDGPSSLSLYSLMALHWSFAMVLFGLLHNTVSLKQSDCLHGGWKRAKDSSPVSKVCAFYDLASDVIQHHFHHVLLVEIIPKACPISREEDLDFTPQWEECQIHTVRRTCWVGNIVTYPLDNTRLGGELVAGGNSGNSPVSEAYSLLLHLVAKIKCTSCPCRLGFTNQGLHSGRESWMLAIANPSSWK